MPNIIEQQDLLKGLPDDRLSALMQNPTGDIPPFLVAAEAQRRQSIREQFSGGPQESVVDTLTKQMANVPQNIQAPAQQPPQMPQQPEMGGVAALQGEQQMRDGGYVQRYQTGSLVTPTLSRVQDVADQFGITVDQAAEMMKNNPSISGTASPSEYGSPFPVRETSQEASASPFSIDLPSITISPADFAVKQKEAAREAKYQEMYGSLGYGSPSPSPAAYNSYGKTGAFYRSAVEPKVPTPETDPGKETTSDENKLKEYEAQLRAISQIGSGDSAYIKGELQKLYGDNEASDWEKAQKWFAAAQAAIEPGQNNWQAAVNALSAFGGGMAEERAAERAGDRELAEALLKYELADRQYRTEAERDVAKDMLKYRISLADAERKADAERIAAEKDALKYGTDINIKQAEMFGRSAQKSEDDLVRLVNSLRQNGITDEEIAKNAEVVSLQKRIKELYDRQNDALATSSLGTRRYGETAGVDLSFEEADGISPIRRVQ